MVMRWRGRSDTWLIWSGFGAFITKYEVFSLFISHIKIFFSQIRNRIRMNRYIELHRGSICVPHIMMYLLASADSTTEPGDCRIRKSA